jgi:GDPmannose 4,6-dehydratase
MWMMLQHSTPDDYVLATGRQISVRDFVKMSFNHLGIDIQFRGEGLDEVGFDKSGRVLVEIDPKYFRPTEVDTLLGDYTKAKNVLGWEPEYTVEKLCEEMVNSDYKYFKNNLKQDPSFTKVFG